MDTRRELAEALTKRLNAMVDGYYLKIICTPDGRHTVNEPAWATFSAGLEQLDETIIELGDEGHDMRALLARRDELADFYRWSIERRQTLILNRLEAIIGPGEAAA